MKRNGEKRWFRAILDIIRGHRACAIASVNVEHLLTCWQIGGVLSAKIKQDGWGRATIDRLVDFIHANAPDERGYGRSSLYNMVAVCETFSAQDFAALVAKYGDLIVQSATGQIVKKQPDALDRDVKRTEENPSIGVLLCKSADHSMVEYALSRTMSPAMIAEYKRVMIPKEVLQETFESYLALPSATEND